MVVKVDVERVDGRAMEVTAFVGDIGINYVRTKDGGYKEVSRRRYGVRVLDQDTMWIPPGEYSELCQKLGKIFSEDRSKSRPRKKSKKKLQSELQGKLF